MASAARNSKNCSPAASRFGLRHRFRNPPRHAVIPLAHRLGIRGLDRRRPRPHDPFQRGTVFGPLSRRHAEVMPGWEVILAIAVRRLYHRWLQICWGRFKTARARRNPLNLAGWRRTVIFLGPTLSPWSAGAKRQRRPRLEWNGATKYAKSVKQRTKLWVDPITAPVPSPAKERT